jgi:hypothetical protein
MLARHSTPDMPSVRGRGSVLKSASDGSRRSRCCGRFGIVESFKVGWAFTFAAAAYNLVRMRNLTMQAT